MRARTQVRILSGRQNQLCSVWQNVGIAVNLMRWQDGDGRSLCMGFGDVLFFFFFFFLNPAKPRRGEGRRGVRERQRLRER